MKKIIVLTFNVLVISVLFSCTEKPKEVPLIKKSLTSTMGVAILDSTGKIADYDWTKVKTTGNFSILPTGLVACVNSTTGVVYQKSDETVIVNQILSAFEEKFNVQVLSTSMINPSKDRVDKGKRHIVLNVVHQPKDTLTPAILKMVTTLFEENAKLKRNFKSQSKKITSLEKVVGE